MTALALEYLNDDTPRAELGRTLLAARKSRYLSVDDVATALNMMPCHIRLIESAQYDVGSQKGMFLDLVEKYCGFLDVRLAAPKMPATARETLQHSQLAARGKQRFPAHAAAAFTAAAMVMAVFLPVSKLANETGSTFLPMPAQPPAVAAGIYSQQHEPIADGVAAMDLLASSEKPQFVQSTVFESGQADGSANGGIAQHFDEQHETEELDLVTLAPAAAVLEEPATYPAAIRSDEFAVQEVSSFIEGLRSLADRS